MTRTTSTLLVVAAMLSAIAALLHLACLIIGAPMFRLMGAGKQMAQLHLAGYWYPVAITSAIAVILLVRDAHAGGAGVADEAFAQILLIPDTSSVVHLRENLQAERLELSDEDVAALDGVSHLQG